MRQSVESTVVAKSGLCGSYVTYDDRLIYLKEKLAVLLSLNKSATKTNQLCLAVGDKKYPLMIQ